MEERKTRLPFRHLTWTDRLKIEKMLKEKRTYLEIAQMTGASTATISRVNRALIYGSDGYSIVLDRLRKD